MGSELQNRLPKYFITREYVNKGKTTTDRYEGEVPMEVQNYATQVLGDGQARISVTADFGMKDYGNGANGSVTISLSCNQDDTTINNVVNTLSIWTRAYAKQHFEAMDKEFQQMFFTKKQEGPPSFKP
jgi:hypothetical protein